MLNGHACLIGHAILEQHFCVKKAFVERLDVGRMEYKVVADTGSGVPEFKYGSKARNLVH